MGSAGVTAPAIALNGATLMPDASGALAWPSRRAVIVADLHLEKGSSFARHGTLLPPYDTRASLERLALVLRHHSAETVICLGDSFHDGAAVERLREDDAAFLARLVAAHDWVWIAGNHDPAPPGHLGGRILRELALGEIIFRHRALRDAARGEISGHFHPTATVRVRAGQLAGRCFVSDGRRLVLPAFGAFTGGLDVFDPAIVRLFPGGFRVHLIGRERVVAIPQARLAPAAYGGLSHRIG
jgi:DNA ligase-associated metallophosphoesterase